MLNPFESDSESEWNADGKYANCNVWIYSSRLMASGSRLADKILRTDLCGIWNEIVLLD